MKNLSSLPAVLLALALPLALALSSSVLASRAIASPGSVGLGPIVRQDPAAASEVAVHEHGDVLMLRLRDGSSYWGSIDEHDADGLRFHLLSHGGLVSVPWTMLHPPQEADLREQFGYVEITEDELMVNVDRLLLIDGREVTGMILSRSGDHYVVKTDGNLQMVPKARVQSITKGLSVPALDVFTREEMYGKFRGETQEDDPDAQLALAQRCEQILDFQHAVEHYQKTLELDPGNERPEVALALTRAREKAAQQNQIDYLRDVDLLRKRGHFDEGLALLAAFSETFPESPLTSNAQKQSVRLLEARDEAIRRLVRTRWNHHMRRRIRARAGKLDYTGAVTYAQEELSEEIQALVLADVQKQISAEAQPGDILAFWATRKKSRYDLASYGIGTWLLGEDKALAGTGDGAEPTVPKSGKDQERAKLEEKIKRFLKNQQSARRARRSGEQEDEFQAFWASFTMDARSQWIRAFYVEFGGDFELDDKPRLANCRSCGGRGVLEVIRVGGAPGGGGPTRQGGVTSKGVSQLEGCPTCRGIGRVRRVRYR